MLEENTQCIASALRNAIINLDIFQEGFEKLMPSYVGSSIINKPAYLKRNEKFHRNLHQEFVPTIDETIKMIDVWLKFKNSQPCTNAPNMKIAEVLENRKKQNIDKNLLDDFMLATEAKTIQRNGMGALTYKPEHIFETENKIYDYDILAQECSKILESQDSDNLDELF